MEHGLVGTFNHEEFGIFLRCLFDTAFSKRIKITLHNSGKRLQPVQVLLEEPGETSFVWEALQEGELTQWKSRFTIRRRH